MRVVHVAPKDFYIELEIGLLDLIKIRDGLSCATFKYSSKDNPEMEEGAEFIRSAFYEFISGIIEGVEENGP
jgi:hypothetical protein